MKLFNLFPIVIAAVFSTSNLYAAQLTTKVTSKIEWTEEGAYFSTKKGYISVYTLGMSTKAYQSLNSIKKGDCVVITAAHSKLEKYEGTITIMQLQNVKKIACK